MIGVLANDAEYPVIREFFELFKTSWEFYRNGSQYEVLICSGSQFAESSAKLVLIYGSEQNSFDREKRIEIYSQHSSAFLSYRGESFPIYGNYLTFSDTGADLLVDESTRKPAAVEIRSKEQIVVRIGFDVFQEVRHLLTCGQPPANSRVATLDLHIALLRDLLTTHSIPLLEIPPVPSGYNFIACLTHDVDHAGVRNHKWDGTMFGFLYRAMIGSLIDFSRGRRPLAHVFANWKAAFSLPFIYLGLARDFWTQFDRYVELEKGHPSTFFVIPRKGTPGQGLNGQAPPARAARYELAEISDQLQRLVSAGCEVGLHGIEAWRDAAKGRAELQRIREVTGKSDVGVRMHWLYFDKQSPATLEKAGCAYDSTVGYNDTVGYRAGTTQVFRSLAAEEMLELPMHIMDTALFFPPYMNLSAKKANAVVKDLVKNAARLGGVLTVNWHDRSIAPERLWNDSYTRLIDELEGNGAWFATAGQAVSWFRKRRSSVLENVSREGGAINARVLLKHENDNLPDLKLRVHKVTPQPSHGVAEPKSQATFTDFSFNRSVEMTVPV